MIRVGRRRVVGNRLRLSTGGDQRAAQGLLQHLVSKDPIHRRDQVGEFVVPVHGPVSTIETVLWQHDGVTCTSLVFDRHHIEIELTVKRSRLSRFRPLRRWPRV
jgi:hypothetical protein